jgi:hypothetical protein
MQVTEKNVMYVWHGLRAHHNRALAGLNLAARLVVRYLPAKLSLTEIHLLPGRSVAKRMQPTWTCIRHLGEVLFRITAVSRATQKRNQATASTIAPLEVRLPGCDARNAGISAK